MAAVTSRIHAVKADAGPYPTELLEGLGTGLALFSAAFLGGNDVIHLHNAGIRTTCVDTNADRLDVMADFYPTDWDFVIGDAWKFAEDADGEMWDVVSVDPFFGDAATRVWETLDMFLALASRLVTVTVRSSWSVPAPDGWSGSLLPRSAVASWWVLERG